MAPSAPLTSSMEYQHRRIVCLDGLRVAVVFVVFFVHLVQMFLIYGSPAPSGVPLAHPRVPHPHMGLPHAPTSPSLLPYQDFVAGLGMALLFAISGAAVWFSLRRRTARQFAVARLTKLVLPLLGALLLLAPLQQYLYDALRHRADEGSPLAYYPHFFAAINLRASPGWMSISFHHLWFLIDLVAFTLLALPLFLALNRAAGSSLMARVTALVARPGGVFALALPVAALRLALAGHFAGYASWTDHACWLVFFVYGFVVIADPRRAHAVRRQGPLGVLVGVATMSIVIAQLNVGVLGGAGGPPAGAGPWVLFQVVYALALCAWLIALVWVGSVIFPTESGVLRHGNRIVLLFYVLHYAILELAALYILPLPLPLAARALALGASAFVATVALCDALTRRGAALRRVSMQPR